MTAQEALTILGIEDPEDAPDAYELAIFDTRKFLLANPVLLKTFQSRVRKAQKLYEAMTALGFQEEVVPGEEIVFEPSPEVVQHFLNYHEAKGRWKHKLTDSYGFLQLSESVEGLITLERAFSSVFAHFPEWTNEPVLVSKEPDPMEFLSWLRAQEQSGKKTPEDLWSNREYLPAGLKIALKRLSLLPNYLYE